ncbi:MAG: hypothetical protein GY745_09575 [Actinomycetia bacterium]|nr:hypothetical protein [Actinomycetes bacterium]
MIFTQYYLDCLSRASYLIGDETTGRAAVVDPRRGVSENVEDAAQAGLTIDLVLETWSTMADQLESNYALNIADRDELVATITEGQPAAPGCFTCHAGRNQEDRPIRDESAPEPLELSQVDEAGAHGAVIVDARDPAEFAQAHLKGAINAGLEGRFAEYAGSVVTPDQQVVLVTDEGAEQEAKTRLGRIGYDNVVGCVADHARLLAQHPDRAEVASRLTATQLDRCRNETPDLQLVDVRGPGDVSDLIGGYATWAALQPAGRSR